DPGRTAHDSGALPRSSLPSEGLLESGAPRPSSTGPRTPVEPEEPSMRRWCRIGALSVSLAVVASIAGSPAWGQAKSELTVALSSFSAETLDPALQGHNVKYYLSLMFDYTGGTTT